MKTKYLATLAVAMLVCVLGLSACTANQAQPIPPAQVMAIACPPTLAAIAQFQALNATLPNDPQAVKASAELAKIQPAVTAACAAGVTVSVANVQAFAQTVLPALGVIATSLPIKPPQLAQIEAGLTAAQIAVGTISAIQAAQKAQGVQAVGPGTSA